MHEFALIQSVLKIVEDRAQANGITKVTRVKLVIGKMTMALPAALEMAFAALTPDTVAQGARLEIEEREILLRCLGCGSEYQSEPLHFNCPVCGAGRTRIIQGRELYLDYFEGEDEV